MESWSTGGHLAKICERTVEWHLKFIQHLIVLANTVSWEEANREREHFIQEVGVKRTNCANRVKLLCEICICLREGNDKRWRSDKLESKRMFSLLSAQWIVPCKKCGLTIHGTNPCAWERKSDEEARKLGRQLMANLAAGESSNPQDNKGKGRKGKKNDDED